MKKKNRKIKILIIDPKLSEIPTYEEFHPDFLKNKREQSSKLLIPSVSLKPSKNALLAPTENYVAAEHVRMVQELCKLLNIPVVFAPEESTAECTYLEQIGVVDAVASEDNNAILFGSKWLIRKIFSTLPFSITVKSLEKIGLTRQKLLNSIIAMMITAKSLEKIGLTRKK